MNARNRNRTEPTRPRHFDSRWVEREVAALDSLALVPTDVLARIVSERGKCFNESGPLEPPDTPPGEPEPDRRLAEQFCHGCPVQRQCLERELRDNGADTIGIWGGLCEDDRRSLLAQWEARPKRSWLIPTPHEWAQQQLKDAPVRSAEWARSVARLYGFTIPDKHTDT